MIHQCALERDLTLFEAGDRTEVGEKGITLSGGQKARITLARAIYSKAEIVILDDVLAALESVFSRPLFMEVADMMLTLVYTRPSGLSRNASKEI